MSLLSVTVKKANFVGPEAPTYNSYVTLKLQNVKSTTVTVKGATPCWEQDFLFETNDVNTGLLIEVWNKGMIWDRAMGYHWLPLQGIQYSNEEGTGQWLSLEGELEMRDGEVVGTKTPTGHALLVDCRFELPFGRCDPPSGWRSLLQDAASFRQEYKLLPWQSNHDAENIEASDLQRKLELLNNVMDHEARAEQARRQMQYYGHSGYSEDSDYTSDLNYPVSGQHANSSASQFRNVAHQMRTPQMSLETSRENSYERDDGCGPLTPQPSPYQQQHHLPVAPGNRVGNHLSPGSLRRQRYSPNTTDDYGYGGSNSSQYQQRNYQQENSMIPADSDPLFYNSRPRNKTDYSSYDTFSNYNQNYNALSIENVDRSFTDTTDYINQPSTLSKFRKPSLERQTTLDYTTSLYDGSNYINNQDTTTIVSFVNTSGQSINPSSYDEYYDASSYPYQEERYGRDQDEDRQWDAGGITNLSMKKLPPVPINSTLSNTKPRSSIVASDLLLLGGSSSPAQRRIMPQVPPLGGRRVTSRQGSLHELDDGGFGTPEFGGYRGASLPPTPTKLQAAKLLPRVPINIAPSQLTPTNKAFNSLPPTPGRQLPKPNLNHRSANITTPTTINKSSATSWFRRNQFTLKRTISADYADDPLEDSDDVTNISGYDIAGLNGTTDTTAPGTTAYSTNHITNNESNSYIRPGTVSANQLYNEDYNYAYQSTDNLPVVQPIHTSLSTTLSTALSTSLPAQQQYQSPIIINSGLGPMTDLDEVSPYGEFSYTTSGVVTSNTTAITVGGYDDEAALMMTSATSNSALLSQQYSTEDYYYNAQDDLGQQISDNYSVSYDVPSTTSTTQIILPTTSSTTTTIQERRKLLLGANGSRLGTSPLSTLHPNDSFDSRDEDTLRDSFETAVSSMDYPLINSYASEVVNTSAGYDNVTTTYTQYQRDQQPSKVTTQVAATTTSSAADASAAGLPSLPSLASGLSAATSMFGKMSGMAKGFLKQQTIDPGIFTPQQQQPPTITALPPATIQPSTTKNFLSDIDDYNHQQEYINQANNNNNSSSAMLQRFNSVDSYLEEEEGDEYTDINHPSIPNFANGAGLDYNQYNSQVKDSPVSVIHVGQQGSNGYLDEEELLAMRRGSSQITVVDPYMQQQQRDAYGSRRASTESYMMANGGQTIRRSSQESYREYMEEDDLMEEIPVTSHLDTMTSSYQNGQMTILDHPQSQYPYDQQQHHLLPSDVGMLEDVAEEEELEEPSPPLPPAEKKVSFEDEDVNLPQVNGGGIKTTVAATVSGLAAGLAVVEALRMDDRLLEEEAKPTRPQITAQQRWHWAYNKIIMQLNIQAVFVVQKVPLAKSKSGNSNFCSNAPGGHLEVNYVDGSIPGQLDSALVTLFKIVPDDVFSALQASMPSRLHLMTHVLEDIGPTNECLAIIQNSRTNIESNYLPSLNACLADAAEDKLIFVDSLFLRGMAIVQWALCFNYNSDPGSYEGTHGFGVPRGCCGIAATALSMAASMPKLLMINGFSPILKQCTSTAISAARCASTEGIIPILKQFLKDLVDARTCVINTCGA